MMKLLQGVTVCVLLVTCSPLVQAASGKQPEWTPEEKDLADKATKLDEEARKLYEQSKPRDALAKEGKAVEIYRKLYPKERFPDGHPDLATSLSNISNLLASLGESAKALKYCEQALAMRQKLYPKERYKNGHPALALSLNNMSGILMSLGEPAKALPYCEQALDVNKMLYPAERFPNGHPALARSLNDLGFMLDAVGGPAKALPYYGQALAMNRKLYPPERFPDGHPYLAISLHNLASTLDAIGESAKALPYCEQALAMRKKLYPAERFPNGHPYLAQSLGYMGWILQSLEMPANALPYYEQALIMRRKLYPPERFPDGHPQLASSLNGLVVVLISLGEPTRALRLSEEAIAINRKLYSPERFPEGHPALATSLNNMGAVFAALGEPAKALPYYERALAMRKKLYRPERFPNGHPDLAGSLNNLGYIVWVLNEASKALPYFEQALAMNQKLYPIERFKDGHPHLAKSLHNLASGLDAAGEHAEALPFSERALAMRRKLYSPARFPDGHPDVATSLNGLSVVFSSLNKPAKALPHSERALAMRKTLYPPERFPDGHPDLAASLHNLGEVLRSLGEPRKALIHYEQALAMNQKLSNREVRQGSEAQALSYCQQQPPTRDNYLYLSVALSKTNYGHLWHFRGDILPILQARHQQMLALKGSSDEYKDLVKIRQGLARMQSSAPHDAKGLRERDEALAKLTDEQDRLERKLATALPEFKHLKELADKGPGDLARELPKDAAFVDLIRYNQRHKDKIAGQRYVAFLVLPGQDAKLINLGDAKPIDEAATAWRKHIDKFTSSLAPAKLRELVWEKIETHLPAETKVVYLCPDGDLARIPFAALPAKGKKKILLEEYLFAIVPSGPWLLGQLLYPPKPSDAADRVLAIGGVNYGKSADPEAEYKPLDGSRQELKAVLKAFGQPETDGLSGLAASVQKVRDDLPKVRYAHFATHGYFNDTDLTLERQRLKKTLETWTFQELGSRLGGAGMRNPAVYTGLVFAGANAPKGDDKDRGILTGLNILDLPLEGLRLCVLSACETGLGELTEAEGVLGLQRSFHAAGCPNVIGSLWKVNDEATAALMTKFYYELRVNELTPLEALREAQLTLYRHPERIADLAKGIPRGKINPGDTVTLGSKPSKTKAGEPAKTTPTKLWAAFVLSGRGE